tara:strand:+ start:2210 stop:3070 length:861 start_codon:yes stop_codon:yes gene_type:complete
MKTRTLKADTVHRATMTIGRKLRRKAFKLLLKRSSGSGYVNGVILYEGPSTGNGALIVVIATATDRPTENVKTSDMVQVWIVLQAMSPQEAWHQGLDAGSNCPTECMHRSPASGGLGSCYLELYRAPRAVWQAWKDGSYPYLPEQDRDAFFTGAVVRFGAYGDPGMVPATVWDFRHVLKGYTGYTARWSALDSSWQWLTASVPTLPDSLRARSKGWRPFRAKAEGSPDMKDERPCPAVGDSPVPCAICLQCDGSEKGSKRPGRTIEVHGALAKKFQRWADAQEVTA